MASSSEFCIHCQHDLQRLASKLPPRLLIPTMGSPVSPKKPKLLARKDEQRCPGLDGPLRLHVRGVEKAAFLAE